MAVQMKVLTLRVPENIHTKLRMLAAVNQTTMTKIITRLVEHEPLHFPGEGNPAMEMLDGVPAGEMFEASPETKERAEQSVSEFKQEVSDKQSLYEEKQRLIRMKLKAAAERADADK